MNENESLNVAVHRELQEETNLKGLTLCQTAAFGNPGRDPRGHTITVAFHGVIEEVSRALEAHGGLVFTSHIFLPF